MLDSVKIARRQSEIRQNLSTLVGKSDATADEVRSMETFDTEYRTNETRYRAALIAEDTERREAGADLETRSDRESAELIGRFELRQIVAAMNAGHTLTGQTAEVVEELRSAGGFKGYPVPWAALEQRNTVASGTPNPLTTMPIIDRLFPESVAGRMGAQVINIPSGLMEWPVVTSNVAAGWAATEGGNVTGPTAYTTVDKPMDPNKTLGIQMRISRRALMQTGDALEAAIRRDMAGSMGQAMDQAVFLGTGASGQPLGIIPGAATYGITATAIAAGAQNATWAAFRGAIVRFMATNAATGTKGVKVLMRPEVFDRLDNLQTASAAPMWEWDRLVNAVGPDGVTISSNALAAPSGSPLTTTALLTTVAGGSAPIFVGLWGALDMIRDPYTDAQAGGLRLTALATMDVTVARGVQLQIITGLQ